MGGGQSPPEMSAQEIGVLVTQVPESDDELTGCLIGQAIGALVELTLLCPMVGASDLAVTESAEAEAGKDLTGGCDCEGGSHLVSVRLTL